MENLLENLSHLAEKNNTIDPSLHLQYNTKRGLRNSDGTGVLIGLTEIGEVSGYDVINGEKVPQDGRLSYRGIEINDLVQGYQKEKRHGFEEVCFLLLFGQLPTKEELTAFQKVMRNSRELPPGFMEDMILKAPSKDIMNKLARSVLTCYSYDKNPDDISVKNLIRQSIKLIARFPVLVAYGYQAKAHYYNGKSLFIHKPNPELSHSENFLYMIRSNNKFTELEAEVLDLNFILQAEHGGGNNSSFTIHVVSSADTDTYSAVSAAVGSLKGPKHGGANVKVKEMIEDLKGNVADWNDEKQVENYLAKIVKKQAFDKSGLIYGMGHAVYTISDPRAVLLKQKANLLAKEKGMEEEFHLYALIEKLTPNVLKEIKKQENPIVANVDLYSGFVLKMLNIPRELYTPIFAVSRVSGWCAHRIEEIISGGKIIRPAYKFIMPRTEYIPLSER